MMPRPRTIGQFASVCMNITMPLVNVTADVAPTSGQMLGGRIWY
jgi:hypothetical protein